MAFPSFRKVFEVETDTSMIGISVVLEQDGHPIEFFSKKLCYARKKWSTYEQELYSLVGALDHWKHYLLEKEFILRSNHHAL